MAGNFLSGREWVDAARGLGTGATTPDADTQRVQVPGVFDGYIEVVARVSSTCLVTVKRNRYSVPCQWANRRVSVRMYSERFDIYADDAWVASHARLIDRDQVSYDWQHYIPLLDRKPGALPNTLWGTSGAPFLDMPGPLLSLQRALRKHPGGDRAMVDVLACVPIVGLEAVVAAVERLPEPLYTSVEQVRHLATQLRTNDRPELSVIATPEALQLNEAPPADTGRYDQLSGQRRPVCLAEESEHA